MKLSRRQIVALVGLIAGGICLLLLAKPQIANVFLSEVNRLWLEAMPRVRLTRLIVLPGHPDTSSKSSAPFPTVTRMAFSPDGKMLATISYGDYSFKVWNLETGALLAMKPLRARPIDIAFSADNLQIICFTLDHEVCFYRLNLAEDLPLDIVPLFGAQGEGERSGPDPYHYHFGAASLNPERSLAVLTSFDRPSIIWDVIRRKQIKPFVLPRGRAAAFSPDGSQFATGDGSRFQIYDLNSGKAQYCLISKGQPLQLLSIRYSPLGNFLGTAHNDGTITIWDARNLRELHNFFISGSMAYDCAFSRNDRLFATVHPDRGLILWEPVRAEQLSLYPASGAMLVAFSPTADQVAIGFADGRIELLSYPAKNAGN